MKCIFRTRGEAPANGFMLTLTGTLSTNYGYATVDGTKYTASRVLELGAGTEVSVYVGGSALSGPKITYNGETVQSGRGTYTFSLSANTTITFTAKTSQPSYYTADITTN